MRNTVILEFEKELAKDQTLWRIVEEYIMASGSQDTQASLSKMARVWVEIVEQEDVAKCVGITAIAQAWIVPIFHCEDERTRQRMVKRLSTVLEEHAGGRTIALVHIDKEREPLWEYFLKAMEAKSANLWAVPTSPKMNLDTYVDSEGTVQISVARQV